MIDFEEIESLGSNISVYYRYQLIKHYNHILKVLLYEYGVYVNLSGALEYHNNRWVWVDNNARLLLNPEFLSMHELTKHYVEQLNIYDKLYN